MPPGGEPFRALAQRIQQAGVSHVKIGVTDIDGVMRGKYIAVSDILPRLESGLGFCSCIAGWDCDDTLYTNNPAGVAGWHNGYPDIPINLAADSVRALPNEFEGNGLLILAEMGGAAADLCPRALLRRTLDTATAMGYEVLVGIEYEFGLFAESRESARSKNFRNLTPLSPGNFGYSVLRSSSFSPLLEGLLRECAAMDIPLSALHTENGPGIWEAAISATDALAAADRAAIFKTFVKSYVQRHGLLATFMPKWSADHQGLGGHMHISLRARADSRPLFFAEGAADRSSPLMKQFVAGQLHFLPDVTAMVAPTINAYKRLLPGAWAPTNANSGEDNRTCALRLIGNSHGSRRVEFRVSGADANPYLALAAAVASGLEGIRRELPPVPPLTGNAYTQAMPAEAQLPQTLGLAAARLRASNEARLWFGDAFVDHFSLSRDWEVERFQAAITSWELERYFEII